MSPNAIEGAKNNERRSSVFFSAMAIGGYTLTWIAALLLLSEYGLRLASDWFHRNDAARVASKRAYEHGPWASQFGRDYVAYLKARGTYSGAYTYAPFTVVDSEPFHSRYVNVDVTALGALRRSTAANCSPPSLRVWAFGGSTTFGIGVPDDMTWPSYLVEELRGRTGQCVTVENFGVETMSMNQELIRLMQALKTGLKPDLVVFLDGANDSSFGTGVPGPQAYGYYESDKPLMDQRHSVIAPLQNLKVVQYLRRASQRGGGPNRTIEIQGEARRLAWKDDELEARARHTLDNYIADMEVVRALADTYHFRAYFFWQPVSFYGNDLPGCDEPQMIVKEEQQSRGRKAVEATYNEAERRASAARFVSLIHLFDNTKSCLFVDPVHLGPAGNRAVASRIALDLGNPP
jgi:lysophospholipase L1-like esterase